MNTLIRGAEFATAYVDIILLRTENNEQDRKHIKTVFQKMCEYGFKPGSEKCKFFTKQLKYLG